MQQDKLTESINRLMAQCREREALKPIAAAQLAQVPRGRCGIHDRALELDLARVVWEWRDRTNQPAPVWSPCPACEHERTVLLPRFIRWRRAGVPMTFIGATLDGLAEMEESVRTTLHGYAQNPEGALLLLGTPGGGKTHAALAILQAQPRRGLYLTQSDLVARHRATYREKGQADVRAEAMTVSLLVVDEVGRSVGGADAAALLHDIFNHRYAEGLPTVLATNLDRNGLRAELGPAISDRLVGAMAGVIQFTGGSRRGTKVDKRDERAALARRLDELWKAEQERGES